MPSVTFSVRCDCTQWGESVAVVGSWQHWDQSRAVSLSTSANSYPQWTQKIYVDNTLSGRTLEYKYVITRHGQIARWEYDSSKNRSLFLISDSSTSDNFGQVPKMQTAQPSTQRSTTCAEKHSSSHQFPDLDLLSLDPLEKAIVQYSKHKFSWRLRLSFIRSLFTDHQVANRAHFQLKSIDALVTISTYLSFLSSGQLPCLEDGGHHRPNCHAHEARRIEAALPAAIQAAIDSEYPSCSTASTHPESPNCVYIPYVVRKIFPMLPSYSSQFTVSVPLTRIRDIAHRNDIPDDLKLDIKHNLQNKLHRSAGPEDLHTSERILQTISHGGFSQLFVDQFRIFHAELKAFFNAASLNDRLRYLQCCEFTRDIAASAGVLFGLKTQHANPLLQLRALTELRIGISKLPLMEQKQTSSEDEHLPHEDVQKVRLADIDLEGYSFVLLASEAKEVENESTSLAFPWHRVLEVLSIALKNMHLSCIRPQESSAIASELYAVSKMFSSTATTTISMTLRAKAAGERALRFMHEFSDALVDVYGRRSHALGEALGISKHAVDVFAEAEVRSSITFQASRIATTCMSVSRKALNQPAWDVLFVGRAVGRVVYVEKLADGFKTESSSHDAIIVCRTAEGDEDVPPYVRGVIAGRALPHLSHLGVRARQAGVVFVCAEERSVFETFWKHQLSGLCELRVTDREGLATWREISSSESENGGASPGGISGDEKVEIKSEEEDGASIQGLSIDLDYSEVIPIAKSTRDTVSSKCMYAGMLIDVAINSDGLFEAANGVAIPHGVFQEEKEKHSEEYFALVREYDNAVTGVKGDGKPDDATNALRSFIEEAFEVDDQVIASIQDSFDKGTKLMVRSSANAEDLEKMSGAGLYDSIASIQVDNAMELRKAIKKVWASLWTKRAASSRVTYGVKHNQASMAVLIQEMIQSNLSFVAFSREPMDHGSKVYVEAAVGMGETLASAAANGTPYRFRIDRGDFDVEQICFASYSSALVARDATSQSPLCREVVDYSKKWMTTSDEQRTEVVKRIAMAVVMLEDAFDGPQDVEGAVKKSDDGIDIYIVQARPQIV